MEILKDKILLLLIITSVGLIYLITSRGAWESTIEQKGAEENNRLKLSDYISIESDHFLNSENQTIGSATYIIAYKCFIIDSLSVQIIEVDNGKRSYLSNTLTRIADMQKVQFNSIGEIVPESLLPTYKVAICPGQQIEITNWFKYPNANAEDFEIKYYIKGKNLAPVSRTAKLEKVESFSIKGRHHYDFIILLYPILWLIFGLLLLSKIVLVLRKKPRPGKSYNI
ncbi:MULTISPECIES: hypothetical protein [Rufibacter]|uniref:hypothetical protein n=1 Tax=Rufibacter TaxID=1379908 RepID=UPI001B31655F|nr:MULTISPECIES: hypothetical protein [Rufibacter]